MPTAHEPSIEQTPVATAATQKVTSEGKPKSKRGRPPKNRQVNQAPVRDEKAQPLTNAEVQSAPTSSPNDDSPNASGAMLLATIQPASVKNDSAVPVDDQVTLYSYFKQFLIEIFFRNRFPLSEPLILLLPVPPNLQ